MPYDESILQEQASLGSRKSKLIPPQAASEIVGLTLKYLASNILVKLDNS